MSKDDLRRRLEALGRLYAVPRCRATATGRRWEASRAFRVLTSAGNPAACGPDLGAAELWAPQARHGPAPRRRCRSVGQPAHRGVVDADRTHGDQDPPDSVCRPAPARSPMTLPLPRPGPSRPAPPGPACPRAASQRGNKDQTRSFAALFWHPRDNDRCQPLGNTPARDLPQVVTPARSDTAPVRIGHGGPADAYGNDRGALCRRLTEGARHDLPPIRLHDLRHVAATLALTAGVDIKVVSEQLGHTTTQITRDIYLSVMPQVAQSAAEAAAALVPRAAVEADVNQSVDILLTSENISDTPNDLRRAESPGQKAWGGRDSNPRPRDYESPALTG